MTLARCPWYIAGPLLGVLITALRAAVNRPFGALGGYIDLVENLRRSAPVGFTTFFLLGVVAGGGLFAASTGTFAWTIVYNAADPLLPSGVLSQSVVLLLAGIAIGAGARHAGGCTSGHGLCGNSLGSFASMVATMTFFVTAVASTNLIAWLFEARQ